MAFLAFTIFRNIFTIQRKALFLAQGCDLHVFIDPECEAGLNIIPKEIV